MPHLLLFRAMLGGAGLAGCVGLLAGQARADIVEFVPVRDLNQATIVTAQSPPVALSLPGAAAAPVKAAPCSRDRGAKSRPAECDGQRVAMAPSKVRAPH